MFMSPEYSEFMQAVQDSGEKPVCMEIDPDLWFSSEWKDTNNAKKFCAICPLRKDCLTYALKANEQSGVWGGLTLTERRRLQAQGRSRRPGRPSRSPHLR